MTLEELQSEINTLIDAEDGAGLERFVIDHFKEFPEDMQGQILFAFLRETLERVEGEQEIEKIQKEGMEAIKKIAALKAVLQLSTAENSSAE